MPYPNNHDLLPAVRRRLPAHARDVFRRGCNHALAEYDEGDTTVFRVAWSAVKRRDENVGAGWVRKPERS